MDITEISQALGLSSGKVALALVALRLLGETIGSLRNGGGLVGWFRSVLYGQGVPKPIATDYKAELTKPVDKGGAGKVLSLVLCGLLTLAALGMVGCTRVPAIKARSIKYESHYPIGGSTIEITNVKVTETEVKAEKYYRKSRWWYVNQDVTIEGYSRARSKNE